MRVLEALRTISNNDKFEIMRQLMDGPKTHNELCKASNLSPSTVSRFLKSLSECGVVKKCESGFTLTGLGYYIAEYVCNLEDVDEIVKNASKFSRSIPVELKPGVALLKEAHRFDVPYAVVPHLSVSVEKMSECGDFVDGVVVEELMRVVWEKCISGVKVRSIVSPNVLERKAGVGARVTVNLSNYGLENVLSALRENLEVRVSEITVQMALIDDSVVYIQILRDNSMDSPVYASTDSECIKWAKNLYEHYWKKAKKVDFVSMIESYIPAIYR